MDGIKKDNQRTTHHIEHGGFEEMNSTTDPKTEISTQQDLFDVEDTDINFRSLSWQGAAILIAKLQIGLGALSLPSTFHTLGFFPGILCFVVLSCMTTIAGYVSGNARQYFPQIHSIGDAAEMILGTAAKEVMGVIYYLYLTLVAGAGLLTTSVALNALSDNGACTTVFVAVACAAAFIFGTSFRSLERVSWLSWVGVAGIIIAIWVTAIACLAQDHPAAAPLNSHVPLDLEIRVFPRTNFSQAMGAVSSQLFAVGASGTFFSVSAEMKRPELFTRALICGQSFIVATCIIIASIVYGKVGQYLSSPALGSAGPLIKKIAYGIALPGLVVTAILWSHVAAKYWFVRILRGTPHLQTNTIKHWVTWIGSMAVTAALAFIIVGIIPFFDDFLSLVGALVNPVFTAIFPGIMILFFIAERPTRIQECARNDGSHEYRTTQWLPLALAKWKDGSKETIALLLGILMILAGVFIVVGGTYATVLNIKNSYNEGKVSGFFSCADNS
ncbi:hypothetical protein N7509_013017 [Penicillium cosmopolitanum]|uniref:Amino acid transporter transmembrane domain-containing protein n=1 Tax=Penicillium cosmopolitanum TaxID=1131564 RepID=A0A9W9SCK4_9EURO|nr:uncharacterized protein N7509_013017 [Penicillium cosmopolitanum]KAJ5376131.1 hypothetical protein N7509_013017 [Penicillium cosmopolitanum]